MPEEAAVPHISLLEDLPYFQYWCICFPGPARADSTHFENSSLASDGESVGNGWAVASDRGSEGRTAHHRSIGGGGAGGWPGSGVEGFTEQQEHELSLSTRGRDVPLVGQAEWQVQRLMFSGAGQSSIKDGGRLQGWDLTAWKQAALTAATARRPEHEGAAPTVACRSHMTLCQEPAFQFQPCRQLTSRSSWASH